MIDLLVESATLQLFNPLLISLVLILLMLMLGRSLARRRLARMRLAEDEELRAPPKIPRVINYNATLYACDASAAPEDELPPLRKLGRSALRRRLEARRGVPDSIEFDPTREFVRARVVTPAVIADIDEETSEFDRTYLKAHELVNA
jgi:hypothetical protein